MRVYQPYGGEHYIEIGLRAVKRYQSVEFGSGYGRKSKSFCTLSLLHDGVALLRITRSFLLPEFQSWSCGVLISVLRSRSSCRASAGWFGFGGVTFRKQLLDLLIRSGMSRSCRVMMLSFTRTHLGAAGFPIMSQRIGFFEFPVAAGHAARW